jgi:hypothetical protein
MADRTDHCTVMANVALITLTLRVTWQAVGKK